MQVAQAAPSFLPFRRRARKSKFRPQRQKGLVQGIERRLVHVLDPQARE